MGTGELNRPGGVEILLAASCYGDRDKLRPDEPVCSPPMGNSTFRCLPGSRCLQKEDPHE